MQYDVTAFTIDSDGYHTSQPRVERVDTDNPIFAGCDGPWAIEDAYTAFWNRLNYSWERDFPRGKEKVIVAKVEEVTFAGTPEVV